MPEQYPKWLYHRTENPVVVYDPDEHAAKGDGWAEAPFTGDDPEEVKPKGKKNASR